MALSYVGGRGLISIYRRLLSGPTPEHGFLKKMCYKAGVPGATDTPNAVNDICIRTDSTPNHIYLNTTLDPAGAANVWALVL